MELVRKFPFETYQQALQSWTWLPEVVGKTPAFTSPFGDVFLKDQDGAYWFLDGLEGRIGKHWSGFEELQEELMTPAGQDQYLMAGLAEAAVRSGLEPGPDQVLAFKVPPIVGGPMEVENIELFDFVVILDILGQIHQQVRDLPEGQEITGFTINGEPP